jgi:hypothetical protein
MTFGLTECSCMHGSLNVRVHIGSSCPHLFDDIDTNDHSSYKGDAPKNKTAQACLILTVWSWSCWYALKTIKCALQIWDSITAQYFPASVGEWEIRRLITWPTSVFWALDDLESSGQEDWYQKYNSSDLDDWFFDLHLHLHGSVKMSKIYLIRNRYFTSPIFMF